MTIKNIILGIAIIIVTIMVSIYGINTFYPKPEYNQFCNNTVKTILNESECIANDGVWNPVYAEMADTPKSVGGGYCDVYYKCQMEYEEAMKSFSKRAFLIAIPLGVILITVGGILFSLEVVGAGLMGGGVGVIIYGIGGYWSYTQNWMKFLITSFALAALIYVAYYLNKRISSPKKKK